MAKLSIISTIGLYRIIQNSYNCIVCLSKHSNKEYIEIKTFIKYTHTNDINTYNNFAKRPRLFNWAEDVIIEMFISLEKAICDVIKN